MNFHVHLVLWCVLLITKQCLTAKECVQRRLGACTLSGKFFSLDNFYNPQPDEFLLKTSMEFNYLENKNNFEKNLLMEKKRPVTYNSDNAAIVKINIGGNIGVIEITLGQKYYRLAELVYRTWNTDFKETKYNRYTPMLPTFPYNLHLQVTINGTFSIYADGNTEPFLDYQLKEPFQISYISFDADDLIGFVDCSVQYKKNCGVRYIEKLYGCREWFVEDQSHIGNLKGFQKIYENVLFDEFLVVDAGNKASLMEFNFKQHVLSIGFDVNFIWAIFEMKLRKLRKSVKTEQLFEVPQHPYAVRILLTTGENNNSLIISNLRNNTIISMNLCEDIGSLEDLWFFGPKLYFDCFTSDDYIIMSERPRKTIERKDFGTQYHKNGYNYTKTFIDTSDFVSEPFTMYLYDFGNSTQDWCPDEPKPEVVVTSKYNDDTLEGIIERSNREILSELKKMNAQNHALLTELKKVSGAADTNAAELKVISGALTTHLKQNITTV